MEEAEVGQEDGGVAAEGGEAGRHGPEDRPGVDWCSNLPSSGGEDLPE